MMDRTVTARLFAFQVCPRYRFRTIRRGEQSTLRTNFNRHGLRHGGTLASRRLGFGFRLIRRRLIRWNLIRWEWSGEILLIGVLLFIFSFLALWIVALITGIADR